MLAPAIQCAALALAASAGAAHIPRSTTDDQGLTDFNKICNGELNAQTWQENNLQGSFHALGSIGIEKYTGSFQQLLLGWNPSIKNWNCSFTHDGSFCESTAISNPTNCGGPITHAEATMCLMSMSNFGAWMQDFWGVIQDAWNKVAQNGGTLIKDFLANGGEPTPTQVQPFFIIAGALLGAIPEAGGIAAGALGTVTGILGYANSQNPTEQQLMELNDYEDFVNKTGTAMQNAINKFADYVVNGVPDTKGKSPNDYVNAPDSIPNIFNDGMWASNQNRSLPGDISLTTLPTIINSFGINWAMNSSKIIVVKTSGKDSGISNFGTGDLCAPQSDTIPLDPSYKWCDDQGNMYTLLEWRGLNYKPSDTIGVTHTLPPNIPGWDKFGTYGQDPANVMQSSWKKQSSSGQFRSSQSNDAFINSLSGMDFAKPDIVDLLAYNLPVCDLDQTHTWSHAESTCPGAEGDPKDPQCLLRSHAYCRCHTMANWPQDLGESEWARTDCKYDA